MCARGATQNGALTPSNVVTGKCARIELMVLVMVLVWVLAMTTVVVTMVM